MLERVPKYTLRKLSVGLASVMIGSGILMNSPKVLADTINSNKGTSTAVKPSSQIEDKRGKSVTEAATITVNNKESENELKLAKASGGAPASATTTNAEEKVVATNPQDKDKRTNANETTQNTTGVGKKDTEVTPTNDATTPATPKTTAKFKVLAALPKMKVASKVNAPAARTAMKAAAPAETPDPTVPDNSANTAIINDKDSLEKTWLETSTERAQVYITVKGTDQKNYVSSYADFKNRLYSEIYTNRMDPNSLELHIKYQVLKDRVQNFIVNWGESLRLDTSRIGKDGLTFTTDTGEKVAYTLTPGWGKYKTYDEWLKEGQQDMSAMNALKIGNNLKAGTNFTLTAPLKYIGRTDGEKQFNNIQVVDYGHPNANMGFGFVELHPEKIDTPEAPTTDKDTVTTGIYNNPQITASDWHKMAHGQVIAYYTAKGKDRKTYVTGYVTANNKSESIINVDQIDPNTLEYHLIYHNGDKEVGSGLWFNFADNKTVAIDTSRLGANGPQLKSQQGWSYGWGINGTGDGGNYYRDWAEYLKAHNGSGDKATQITMTGTAFKPDDRIEFIIPVKYIGQLSDQVHSLTFAPQVNDYGGGNFANGIKLYFTTVRKDLSKVKRVDLLPAEFMGEQPGQSYWKPVKEISKDMPNGWDAFKISNFPTYKGSFNMDSLPKGDRPSLVYGSAQYFIDLRKIQEIFASHGYTVKYANNNGKAQEMPFYAYSTLPGAFRVDDDRPVLNDPSIWVIQVQAVPAIILNKDQHYVADPNAKSWDTTSMIDEIYAADDPGARKTRDQLTKLPKTDVDISYEYQAPGAATAVAVDKVDLTKAGVYTVTYSHTYADGQVVKDSRKVYVDGVKQETKDITRTIIVHTPNESDQKVIQTATLTREVILDATTGEVVKDGEWTTGSWKEFVALEHAGYTPNIAKVEQIDVTADTQDTTVEINYTANDQQTHVIYVDDDNNLDPIKKEMLNGKTGETVATNIANPDESKYELVGTPEAEYTFAAENNEDVIVHLKHKHGKQVEEKTITRTINVTHPDGSHESIKQTVTLNRTNEVDLATGEVVKDGEWTTGSWKEFVALEHAGYTPNIAKVEQIDVTADTQDTTVEINYTANKPTTPEQNNDQGQKPQTNDQGQKPQTEDQVTENGKGTATANKPTTPEQNNDQGQKPQTNDQGQKPQAEDQVTENGKGTATANTQGQTPAPVAQSAQAQKLPHTGEAENRLGILGVLTATLGMLGLGWKKRERQ
ncbi:mucin-binding protein [Lactobacillus sp. UMNPBX1]|nr:YSIRK-type signal peptide-containing protein [Lactobacillus sp. UMNPBX1]PEH11137.1 mucin-binding protein [Lactobacillus sp. UMNPBX1]